MTPATYGSLLAACRERAESEPDAGTRLSVLHLAHGPAWTIAWAARDAARAPDGAGAGTSA
ncbi:hypothetical protein [Conexibacter woesei]|uniref:Uncharacterized protein n=1 Tax=Conexibacter woesei (strain DSM 14684 / CCUG 47730 / CIP 108061 / JCM 11494 / NBRC 100937 / ID131577) TaxID=469383 RepID=D3F3C3_CONWI|nr:hypothetical protein [Conexibacter woesei]ADB50403.1 hypothetical protein Cwoe_1977 [Conexibacter woesei DSM 14684]